MTELRNTMLIADGDASARSVLRGLFSHKGDIAEAGSVSEAIEAILKGSDVLCVALVDEALPGGGALALLRELYNRGISRRLPLFVLISEVNDSYMREVFRLGATDVLIKPIMPFVALRRIAGVVELYKTRARLTSLVEMQEEHMNEQTRQIIELSHGMVESLAAAIEFRSEESGTHVRRIREITSILLSETVLGEGLGSNEIEHIALASVLHDVGKIAVPDAILNKPGKLTREEFEIMKRHTVQGDALLASIPPLREHGSYKYALDIARHHHERGDGKGYPDGLKYGEISPWSRAVSLADVYDALRMQRVYKPAYSHSEAKNMIRTGQCGGFDGELLESFMQVEGHIASLYK